MRHPVRTPIALVLALLLVSCRAQRGPGGEVGARIDRTRAQIETLREAHRAASDDVEQLRTQAALVRLQTEMLQEFGQSPIPAVFVEAPSDDSLPPADFIAGSVGHQLKVHEAMEELWLAGPVAHAFADVSEAVGAGRRMHEEFLATYARQNGHAYDYTDDQRAYVRSIVDLRGVQLRMELHAESREFLQTSLAWWAARCPAPP